MHVAHVRGSVLLQHVDDRLHRLSAGRGDGSAQRGRSVIYDCLSFFVLFAFVVLALVSSAVQRSTRCTTAPPLTGENVSEINVSEITYFVWSET